MKFTFAPESRPLEGYTIKRAIHRGGFGEVYYALSDAGKEVALKLLHNNLEVELRGVSQCLNLKHPNLVTIFDMRQDSEKDHWIVMEYVGGKGLYEVLQEHPSGMALKDVMFWMSGITSGLSFLHDRGIVHRDLKPANIFSESGIVKIGDVGLSKYISESRRSAQTQSVGTVYYMAPEVARGRYGREVDVYSTGVILYEMITGRVPFEGETTAEILMKHLTAEPDLSVLPEPLRPVLAAALEKDPERRISEIEELDRRFRRAIQDSGYSMEKPAPVLASNPDKARRSAPAMATTLIPDDRPRASAPADSGIAGQLQALTAYWNDSVPTPVKWVAGATALVVILNQGLVRLGPREIFALAIVYFVYRRLYGKSAEAETHSKPQAVHLPAEKAGAAVNPAAGVSPSPAAPPVMVSAQRTPLASVPQPMPSVNRIYTPATLRQIPASQRAADVTASLSISLGAVVLVTLAVHLATDLLPNTVDTVFFGTVTLIAAWSLIVPAKMWEGKSGDSLVRKLIQGGLGMGTGALASVIRQFLMVTDTRLMHADGSSIFTGGQLGRISMIDAQGFPTTAGFMVFFGMLFLLRRWWWQADSFRKSRFRISSALVTLLLGVVLTGLLPFPETLGATWALAISAVIQLSSGWTPQEDRLLAPAPGTGHATPMVAQVRHPVMAGPSPQKV